MTRQDSGVSRNGLHLLVALLLVLSAIAYAQLPDIGVKSSSPSVPAPQSILLTYYNTASAGATFTYDMEAIGSSSVSGATWTQSLNLHTKTKYRWQLLRNDQASNVVEITETLIDAIIYINGVPTRLP